VFSILSGYTLGEYIRLRRLSLAGAELAGGKGKVIDVALKYGYDSPDSFAKAFQKFHGMTPSQARADGSMLKSFSRLSIKILLIYRNFMIYCTCIRQNGEYTLCLNSTTAGMSFSLPRQKRTTTKPCGYF
jgi:hypothetical protein